MTHHYAFAGFWCLLVAPSPAPALRYATFDDVGAALIVAPPGHEMASAPMSWMHLAELIDEAVAEGCPDHVLAALQCAATHY
jgi:hypothetical protein